MIEFIGSLIQFLLCYFWIRLFDGGINNIKGKLIGITTERTPSIEILGYFLIIATRSPVLLPLWG